MARKVKENTSRKLIEDAKKDLAGRILIRARVMSEKTGLSVGYCANLVAYTMVKR